MSITEPRFIIIKKAVSKRIRDFLYAEDTILIALSIIIGFMASLGASAFVEAIKFFKLIWTPFGGYSGFVIGDITTLLGQRSH